MQLVQVRDKQFEPYLSEAIILEKVIELATQINKDYEGKKPLLIAVLNGSFIFAADLFKHINIEAEISFIKLASYKGTRSSGHVITAIGLDTDVTGRHVIIMEDIIDTGKTLTAFLPQLYNQQPESNKFVVGYGLDYDGFGRNLPEIYQLHEG